MCKITRLQDYKITKAFFLTNNSTTMKNKSKGKKTNHNHTQRILLNKIALHLNYLSDRRNPNNGYAHYEMGPWKKSHSQPDHFGDT